MKVFIINLLFLSLFFSSNGQELLIKNVGGTDLKFDPDQHYLNIDINQLNNQVPSSTKWLQRLFGKKANLVMAYAEIGQGSKVTKVPIFKYKKVTDDRYDFETIGVLKDGITYPLIQSLPYNASNPPIISLHVRSWTEKDEVSAIEKILDGAQAIGGVNAAQKEAASKIANTVIDLINTIWPSTDKTNKLSIALTESNIRKSEIAVDFKNSDSKADPVLTLGIRLTEAVFIKNKSFSEAVNTLSIPEIEIWRKAINAADTEISKTGLFGVVLQLDNFAQYVQTLDLVYNDKVLLVAGALSNWAGNSVEGYTDTNGKKIQYCLTHYRKLPVSDWKIVNLHSDYLKNVCGNDNCSTGSCFTVANFISKMRSTEPDQLESVMSRYVAPRITLNIDGQISSVTRKDFLSKMLLYNESGYKPHKNGTLRSSFIFKKGNLKFEYDGKQYLDSSVIITVLQNDNQYFVSDIEIASPVS
ncbi:MAG: hypothetical protein RIG77_17935 [Cyclobacteriaceae bacterium]